MEITPNYGLKKPATSDIYQVSDFNENSDKIDFAMKAFSDSVSSHTTSVLGAHSADSISFATGQSGLTATNAGDALRDLGQLINSLVVRRGGKKYGRLVNDFSASVLWWGLVEQTTSDVMTGATSLKISTNASNVNSAAQLQNLDCNWLKSKNLVVRVYAPDLTNLSKITFRFSATTGMTNYLQWEQSKWKMVPGWNEFFIPLSNLTAVGTATVNDLSGIQTVQLVVQGSGTYETFVVFDAMYVDYYSPAQVMFHFDDGWTSQYSKALPILRNRGFVGNVGVISGFVGTAPYMSEAQLKSLHDHGWDLFNHTKTHSNLSAMNNAQIATEVIECRDWLNNRGFSRASSYVAYPLGAYNQSVVDTLTSNGFRFGRAVHEDIEVLPPINPYKLKILEITNGMTSADYGPIIDRVIQTGGSLVLLLHRIEDSGTDSTIYTTANFKTLVDYIFAKKTGLEIVTISEWANSFG